MSPYRRNDRPPEKPVPPARQTLLRSVRWGFASLLAIVVPLVLFACFARATAICRCDPS